MIKLDSGNVLLKPSQRKQLMSWLRRSLRLGGRLGNFILSISFKRTGTMYQANASVKDSCGDFACRSRAHDWRGAMRELIKSLSVRLHDQCLRRSAMA